MSNKVQNVSDLKLMFHRNERPIYFISATNFNLAGIDERVQHFKFINYIDCFDGRHPNVFVPREAPHGEFESIEDITNYLLEHKEVVDYIRGQGASEVVLGVVDGNDAARALYERYGFVDTGVANPLREGEALIVREMKLQL